MESGMGWDQDHKDHGYNITAMVQIWFKCSPGFMYWKLGPPCGKVER